MNRAIRLGSLLIPFLLLFSCVPRPVPQQTVPKKGPRPAISINVLEKEIHDLINQERANHGLARLSWNPGLEKIARKHSLDMANRRYFSHYSPEGHDFSYRYRKAGYTCAIREQQTIYMGAENIFQNNLYDRVLFVNNVPHYDWNSARQIAESTVKGWMNSPGHRKNILTPYWRSEGIGVAVAPDDKVYVTENFC